MANLPNDKRAQLEMLYAEMAPAGLAPLWETMAQLVLAEPRSPARVHRWSYGESREYLMRAGDLISANKRSGASSF